ncbi:KGGVGR-motif variant AAA ATPase [Xanthobacter flavus]|uniref:KGGVGR-motif variant AAA ATPase n=1 Tax=Xanthobacter flavus TaxID=281 RepID=UPI00372B90B4
MTSIKPDIDTGLDAFVAFLDAKFGALSSGGRVVRDVFGRLTFVAPSTLEDSAIESAYAELPVELRPFLSPKSPLLPASGSFSERLLGEGGIPLSGANGTRYILLDRRVSGDSWLSAPLGTLPKVPRLAFYGLKGGVGRSTALAICAADLALAGANVLVLDLDLEAPGLENILLRPDRVPEYGVLDWLSGATAGLDVAELVPDMIGGSPFTSGKGLVDVIPVVGLKSQARPGSFLGKLSRAYTPGAPSGDFLGKSFAEKVEILLGQLSGRRRYDAILIDVRAGLHETSAASLLGLGAKVLLFGTNSPHTFSGYSILLSTVRQAMESWKSAPELRDRFRMVHSRALSSPQERTLFQSNCWQLWLNHLYDAVGNDVDDDAFSFDLDDQSAPHYPLTISSSDRFMNFNPDADPNLLAASDYGAIYNELLGFVRDYVFTKGTQ